MKNIINTSYIQRKGLKDVYKMIEKYGEVMIHNNRNSINLKIVDSESPQLLINIIKSLKSIKESLNKKYGITKIGLFGSYVRGEQTQTSDLDILLEYKPDSLKTVVEIEKLISKATNIKKIDAISHGSISGLAFITIEREIIYV